MIPRTLLCQNCGKAVSIGQNMVRSKVVIGKLPPMCIRTCEPLERRVAAHDAAVAQALLILGQLEGVL